MKQKSSKIFACHLEKLQTIMTRHIPHMHSMNITGSLINITSGYTDASFR